jgi:hypothetical protein
MAGTLVITTLSDGTNSTSATNLVKAPCVAWVNFDGTGTVAIRASYNVSSITDNGTGDYTVNFTNALTDANYTPVVSTAGSFGVSTIGFSINTNSSGFSETAPTTTAFRFVNVNSGGTYYDTKYGSVAVFR